MAQEKAHLRLVVKVGTSTVTQDSGRLNLRNLDLLARTLSDLNGMGHEVILVSSGAIGVGTVKLRLPEASFIMEITDKAARRLRRGRGQKR